MEKLEEKLNKKEKIKEVLKSGFVYGTLGLCSYILIEYLTCKITGNNQFNQDYLKNYVPIFYENLPKAFFIFGGIGTIFKLDEE